MVACSAIPSFPFNHPGPQSISFVYAHPTLQTIANFHHGASTNAKSAMRQYSPYLICTSY